MTLRKLSVMLALPAATLTVLVALRAAESRPATPPESSPPAAVAVSATNATARTPPLPGPNDGRIAYVAARMLEQNHYSRRLLDDELSERFFERYLDALDPRHLHFTQEDLAEFAHYRQRLDDLTVRQRRAPDAPPAGDTTAAYEIFNRFFKRLSQRVEFVDEMLQNEKFEFTSDERMLTNRRKAPYPKDLAEARDLWRQGLRYEYLQERLARLNDQKKPDASAKISVSPSNETVTATSPSPALDEDPAETATASTSAPPAPPTPEVKKKTMHEQIADLLTRRYHRNLHYFRDWDSDDVLQAYLTALARVYDPHSDYMNKIQSDNFAIGMNNALFGIGAVLTTDADGYCKIQELKPGPAMKSKQIKAGDRIVAVAQSNAPPVDTVEMALNKVVQMIRGPEGTEVRLTIQPANKDASDRFVVNLVREQIKLEEQAAKAKVIELADGPDGPVRLGVIDLPAFYALMDFGREPNPILAGKSDAPLYGHFPSVDVAAILKKFKEEKVAGVILDLRRNGGGSLDEAIKVAGLFINEGPIVQVRLSDNRKFVREDPDPSMAYDGPLVVLTSRFSASASEIVAGALQDYGRAVIVGDIATHGKGTVQNLNPLRPYVQPATATATNDPGQLKVTIQKFYRASGASTQLRGVMPDIVLPAVVNHSTEIGEDSQDNPLPWDNIASAKFERFNLVEPCLAELLKRSNARVAADPDFAYVREDIEEFRKHQADKTISLNEAFRLKEKAEADARQKARDQERRARAETGPTVYELTLKQLDQPGLPPPVAKTNAVTKASADGGDIVAVSTNVVTIRGGAIDGRQIMRDIVAVSTNVVTIAASATPPLEDVDEEDAEASEKPPVVDPWLREAERILADYISLLGQQKLLSVKQ